MKIKGGRWSYEEDMMLRAGVAANTGNNPDIKPDWRVSHCVI